jgi:hypothetical protein
MILCHIELLPAIGYETSTTNSSRPALLSVVNLEANEAARSGRRGAEKRPRRSTAPVSRARGMRENAVIGSGGVTRFAAPAT